MDITSLLYDFVFMYLYQKEHAFKVPKLTNVELTAKSLV